MPSVGLYLGVVQFFFAASWIVYVLYLPQLAAQAGIGKAAVAWILMADQLVFVFADYASGVAADRVSRAVGRIGQSVLAATLVSCAAFLALPFVAPGASPAIFLALTLIWAVTSSALRAPPLSLVGKHAAKPTQPVLVALSLLGLGVANAMSPYLGLTLRGVDPRIPFLLSSVALALVTLGLVAVERKLARERAVGGAAPAAEAAPATDADVGGRTGAGGDRRGAVRRARLPGARLHRQRAALSAPGLARADADAFAGVLDRLQHRPGAAFAGRQALVAGPGDGRRGAGRGRGGRRGDDRDHACRR